jgi:hypothetical protein
MVLRRRVDHRCLDRADQLGRSGTARHEAVLLRAQIAEKAGSVRAIKQILLRGRDRTIAERFDRQNDMTQLSPSFITRCPEGAGLRGEAQPDGGSAERQADARGVSPANGNKT